jgi:hypothetical protein
MAMPLSSLGSKTTLRLCSFHRRSSRGVQVDSTSAIDRTMAKGLDFHLLCEAAISASLQTDYSW